MTDRDVETRDWLRAGVVPIDHQFVITRCTWRRCENAQAVLRDELLYDSPDPNSKAVIILLRSGWTILGLENPNEDDERIVAICPLHRHYPKASGE